MPQFNSRVALPRNTSNSFANAQYFRLCNACFRTESSSRPSNLSSRQRLLDLKEMHWLPDCCRHAVNRGGAFTLAFTESAAGPAGGFKLADPLASDGVLRTRYGLLSFYCTRRLGPVMHRSVGKHKVLITATVPLFSFLRYAHRLVSSPEDWSFSPWVLR